MSPSEQFYDKLAKPTEENEKRMAEFSASRFLRITDFFLMQVRTGNNQQIYGYLDISQVTLGSGSLKIPVRYSQSRNEDEMVLHKSAELNQRILVHSGSSDNYQAIGLNFQEQLGNLRTNSIADENTLTLVVSKEHYHTIEPWRDIYFQNIETRMQTMVQSAIGIAHDIEETLGWTLTPLPFQETLEQFRSQ